MLAEQAPACVCTAHPVDIKDGLGHCWTGGGGQCGPGFSQTNWTCTRCGRRVLAIEVGTSLVFYFRRQYDDEVIKWINEIFLPRVAATARRLIAAIEREVYTSGATNEKHTLEMLEVRKRVGALRIEIPKLPYHVDVFQWRGGETGAWTQLDNHASQSLDVPPDPQRVESEAAWTALFLRLESVLGKVRLEETRNLYDGTDVGTQSEPWYHFQYGDQTITVGWRKRVVAITSSVDLPAALVKRADEDRVTYGANFVHAYGLDKVEEYLKLLIGAAL